MTKRTIQMGTILAATALLGAMGSPSAVASTSAATGSAAPPPTKVFTSTAAEGRLRELLVERWTLLREAAAQAGQQYAAGQIGIEERHRAEIAALLAEVDITRTAPERIVLRESILKIATEMERLARIRFAQGGIRREAMTAATLGRVEAQVALGREKAAHAAR